MMGMDNYNDFDWTIMGLIGNCLISLIIIQKKWRKALWKR